MKITGVEPILAGKRYLFLRLTTDSGLIGYGECGAWGYQEATALVNRSVHTMEELCHAVGWDADISVEVHRGLRPAEAIELGRSLQPYRPHFYEDPIPDNLEAMRTVIRECEIPVATGERFINPAEFDSLMTTTGYATYVRICVSAAACLQLDAVIPNFEIQEYPMGNDGCRLDCEMKEPFHLENGYIHVPEGPGLGVELIDDIDTVFPFQGSYGGINLHEDGSIVDR